MALLGFPTICLMGRLDITSARIGSYPLKGSPVCTYWSSFAMLAAICLQVCSRIPSRTFRQVEMATIRSDEKPPSGHREQATTRVRFGTQAIHLPHTMHAATFLRLSPCVKMSKIISYVRWRVFGQRYRMTCGKKSCDHCSKKRPPQPGPATPPCCCSMFGPFDKSIQKERTHIHVKFNLW